MQYAQFIGHVQHRAQLPDHQQAIRATRATLETLGERLTGGEAKDLAAQLPPEIGKFLVSAHSNGSFDLDEFFHRVRDRESVDMPIAVYHARVVIEVLKEAVSEGEWRDVRAQLPRDYNRLFDAGSHGRMPRS